MYYYALLKQTNFNPEEQLRLKLFWEKWENKLKSKHMNSSCLCFYGMNKEYIRKTVIEGESRINQIKTFYIPILKEKMIRSISLLMICTKIESKMYSKTN